MENTKREIFADKNSYDFLIKNYPSVVGVIEKEIEQKCKEYSYLTKEQLSKRGFENGVKQVHLDCVKNFVVLVDKEYDIEKLVQINKEQKENIDLKEIYSNIVDLLRKYCDLNEEDYVIVAVWIIGTYLHKEFQSYPYLFLNAMKGSGKTRTLKLITDLSYMGEILLQPTEAVLFRTNSTLGIDEAESITRKGFESLRELLNGSYKKGSKVKRMKQKKTFEGTEQVVEEFDIYRPIVLANINGMEDVLGDRCINVILERSNNHGIVKLAEIWKSEKIFINTKKVLEDSSKQCSLCSVVVAEKVYIEWNHYIYINYILHTNYTNNTNYTRLFTILDQMDLNGREVELCLPLMLIAWNISEEIFDKLHLSIKNRMSVRKQDQFNESLDIMLIDMISQELERGFEGIKELTEKFLQFTQISNEDKEINPKWMGRALKRLNIIKDKKRVCGGVRVILDVKKAQEKIKMYKENDR